MASAEQPSALYDQETKRECRRMVIEHGVKCLTTERKTSACVQRDHVKWVWQQLHETGEAQRFFSSEEREEISKDITGWERFHDSQIQERKPSDLRVCYLGGDNPINDLEVLVKNGVLCQNVWAIEKDDKTLEKAWKAINCSDLRNVRLFKGDILTFLKDFEGQFDIIYYDACGSLPADIQKTLKVIGYVFLYDKLSSPGALITNFLFPPRQPEKPEDDANAQAFDEERNNINLLTRKYLTYRLVNTLRDDNYPEYNEKFLNERTDEENYSDYVTYQVIDSAYLFVPALRMLLSEKKSLWDQIFVSRDSFLKEMESYFVADNGSIETVGNRFDDPKVRCKFFAELSYLQNIGRSILSSLQEEKTKGSSEEEKTKSSLQKKKKKKLNPFCKAWVNEIFPDWKLSPLKKLDISLPMLAPMLFSCDDFILRFSNSVFQQKCLGPLAMAVDNEHGKFPSCCDAATYSATSCLVAGLLYGQLAYPSFPVLNKLLRLNYTAKQRQMFTDVFIFDKCRYVYEQFPTVDCACFAIFEPKQQMVFQMAVDGLRKHLIAICQDVFQFCNVASVNPMSEGGVSFPDSHLSFPPRKMVLQQKGKNLVQKRLFKEAIEVYNKCLVDCPKNAVLFANKAQCYLKLNQPQDAAANCNEALELELDRTTYVKVLYRRGMAFKMMKEYSKAELDLKKAFKMDIDDDKDIARQLSECTKLAGSSTCS